MFNFILVQNAEGVISKQTPEELFSDMLVLYSEHIDIDDLEDKNFVTELIRDHFFEDSQIVTKFQIVEDNRLYEWTMLEEFLEEKPLNEQLGLEK